MNRRLLVFAALAPVAVWLSFPGCFLFGGVLLVSLNDVWHRKHGSTWACYGLLALLVLGSFAALYLGPIHEQRNVAMDSCWVRTFPDWHRPWSIPWWFAGIHRGGSRLLSSSAWWGLGRGGPGGWDSVVA